MKPPQVLLIECLDAPGAAAADALSRARALERSGCEVRALAVEGEGGAEEGTEPSQRRVPVARGRGEVLANIDRLRPELAVIASAAQAGGAVGGWLPATLPARWWPTGLAWAQGIELSSDLSPAPALPRVSGGLAREDPGPFAGLDWAVVDRTNGGRARLTLWDGDYMLVPAPLSGRDGRDALEAFAAVAEDWTAIDLVVLAHPQPDFERLARDLGVGMRVHFAGVAPREAELAWVRAATATMIATAGPLSGGIVMRALGHGCPVLAFGTEGVGAILRRWLDHHRCNPGSTPAEERAGRTLRRVLEHAPEVRLAVERGRAVAALQDPHALGARLARALGLEQRLEAA